MAAPPARRSEQGAAEHLAAGARSVCLFSGARQQARPTPAARWVAAAIPRYSQVHYILILIYNKLIIYI